MTSSDELVKVYWRPGCGACSALRMGLAEAGVVADWHNIWEDEAAAAYVRSVADGNETVPTLVVGDRALVAPSSRAALSAIGEADPELVAHARRWPPLRILQWVSVISLLGASFAVSRAGRTGWSYALDGLALVAFLVIRRLRARSPLARVRPHHDA